MAAKQQPGTTPDTTLFTTAKKLMTDMSGLGIPVSNLCELVAQNGEENFLMTSDPNVWEDDGTPGIYYMTIWGKFVDVRRTLDILNDKSITPLNRLVKVASIAFESDQPSLTLASAFAAIDGLDKVAKDINADLAVIAPV